MNKSHLYVLTAATASGGRILDFGCGDGEVVLAGLDRGLDIWGAEDFSAAAESTPTSHTEGHLVERLKRIGPDGRLPFPDGYFDFVFSNQVLEHVRDPDRVLAEMSRVLANDGNMLHLFQYRGGLREVHFGVPLAHRAVSAGIGRPYLTAGWWLGLGIHREGKTRDEWVDVAHSFVRDKCYYRSERDWRRLFAAANLTYEHDEFAHAMFRLNNRFPRLAGALKPLVAVMFRRLGGLVVQASPSNRPGVSRPAPPGRGRVAHTSPPLAS